MKILLHMGQGKTGTTALQQSLHSAADTLRASGVFYPHFGGNAIAHHLLVALCGDPKNLPVWTLNDLGGPDLAVRKARAAWAATCDAITSNPPKVLILSSELLLGATNRAEKTRLAETLFKLSDDIQPILYIRHPVDLYRSALQEMLKAVSSPKPPVSQDLRGKIEDIEAIFPHPPALVAYDKGTLFQRDTVPDFANRFLLPLVGAVDLPQRQANLGLSAEALVLMARMRAEAGGSVSAARGVARLKKHLLDFDRLDPPLTPLTLLPEVAEAALRSATCHRWLAETGRLVIPGLEIDRIDGAAVPDWMMTAAPETMFPHDPARLARLRQSIDQISALPVRGLTPKATGLQRSPSLQDRFLRFLNRKITAVGKRAETPKNDPDDPPAAGKPGKAR